MIPLDELEAAFKEARPGFSDNHSTRLYRSISWLKAAEANASDADLSFISCYIAMNSLYGTAAASDMERKQQLEWLKKFESTREMKKIQSLLFSNYQEWVANLMKDKYLFPDYYLFNAGKETDWEYKMAENLRHVEKATKERNAPILLNNILQRLYVLRNQLIHGAASHSSILNRQALIRGRDLLFEILPYLIQAMVLNPEVDWGEISFPVLDVDVP